MDGQSTMPAILQSPLFFAHNLQATQAASAAYAAHEAAAGHTAGPTPGRTVTTGMELVGDVASPQGGEMEMAGSEGPEYPEPPPAGSKAAEAGVTDAFVTEAEA